MESIILAAGRGKRLGLHDKPKCLVTLNDQPLIAYVVAGLSALATHHTIIAGDYLEMISPAVSNCLSSVNVIPHTPYSSGNLQTVLTAEPYIAGDFLLANADHAYPLALIHRIRTFIHHHPDHAIAMCDFDRALGDDDMKVHVAQNASGVPNTLTAISKQLPNPDGGYVGMTYIPNRLRAFYFETARAVLADEGDSASVERVLARWIDTGIPISICDVSGFQWLEIDTPEDLARAEAHIKKHADEFFHNSYQTK